MDPEERLAYMRGLMMMCSSIAPGVSADVLATKIATLSDDQLRRIAARFQETASSILQELGLSAAPW
jgi:hypothetical protein